MLATCRYYRLEAGWGGVAFQLLLNRWRMIRIYLILFKKIFLYLILYLTQFEKYFVIEIR